MNQHQGSRKRQASPPPPTPAAIDEDERQYGTGAIAAELNEKYPNRPRNHSQTPLFSELYKSLFDPLSQSKPTPGGPAVARVKVGPHGPTRLSPTEHRRNVIEKFIKRWRTEVGSDIYPAMRLIVPDKDRDRGMYGLKENAIGKLLVKLMKIDKNSEDGYNLLHWKLPGVTTRVAGDFAGRCYEVISKRPMRTDVGDLRIGDVNILLDKLAAATGEAEQLPIFEEFYRRMNPDEMLWLIRIMLRQMKVGATEKTLFNVWHPDGDALFNVSSSLRRVCWDLITTETRLQPEVADVALMQCFQPQLAQFQTSESFDRLIGKLGVQESDPEFWIEEKLDGERMQLHMMADDDHPGGFKFQYWSRKAKDYTYLYGDGFEDNNSALTRHLKDAFHESVQNCILDGEMITWDPKTDKIVAFGTLKTAALSGQKNPFDESIERPVFRVFDILFANGLALTKYTLRDRRKALEHAVKGCPRRLEVHPYTSATKADAIEPQLRNIIMEASEGLVLKNPRSAYKLNSRNDDWIKVKPEYMSEFGESLDCLVIGGYFGSGRRGGQLSSFLCGLRVGDNYVKAGADREKCYSFFKVGGGFKAEDYREIRHHTEGKWTDWDPKSPPTQYVELAGGEKMQRERPDVWIRPKDSVVISVKAASIDGSPSFAVGETLRFPRFRRLRLDRAWDSALDVDQFHSLKDKVDAEVDEKKNMKIEDRRKRTTKRQKKELVVAEAEGSARFAPLPDNDGDGSKGKVFEGLEFCVLSEAPKPIKKTKVQLEAMIKQNGGTVTQRADSSLASRMILIADKKVVKVASLIKNGAANIIRPNWLVDCVAQTQEATPLPYEPKHLFHSTDEIAARAEQAVDQSGDSYCREVGVDELRNIFAGMRCRKRDDTLKPGKIWNEITSNGYELRRSRGIVFRGCVVHLAGVHTWLELNLTKAQSYIRFGMGRLAEQVIEMHVTHIVVDTSDEKAARIVAAEARHAISRRTPVPRVVTLRWIIDCWEEKTLVDEEQYAAP